LANRPGDVARRENPLQRCAARFRARRVCFSERFLAQKWAWTSSRVHRFLKRLEKQSTTRSTKRSGATVYFLNNYNKYQRVSLLSEAGSEAASEASAKHARSEEEDTESIETEKETASAFEAFRKVAAFGRLPEPKTLSEQRRSKLLNLEGNFRDTPKSNGYQPSGPQQPYRPQQPDPEKPSPEVRERQVAPVLERRH